MELAALPSDIYILSIESVHKEVADTTDMTDTVQHLYYGDTYFKIN